MPRGGKKLNRQPLQTTASELQEVHHRTDGSLSVVCLRLDDFDVPPLADRCEVERPLASRSTLDLAT